MWRITEQIDTSIHSSNGVTWGWGLGPEPIPLQAQPQVANDIGSSSLSPPSFPPDTRAIIHKPGRSTTSSGKTRACEWMLSFQPCSAQFIEPLMGWCGGDDPLRHVELRFPTREAAVSYAERHGIAYEVSEPAPERHADVACPDERTGLWTQWMLDCLRAFEAGAQWWDNAGPDRRLIATLDRWEQNAGCVEAAERTTVLQGGASRLEETRSTPPAPNGPMMHPAAANADIPQDPEEVSVA
ncbi:MAG TPA: NADH dehydrogenase ubiquinone Fe-S protein 4 [Azospirillum sp.]|nr:NADH dehydrogenase ubiquinone Fe-S protein 4 [Azospirillum sp.]